MFSTSTVASSTSMPIASARPPSVIRLRVLPVKNRPMIPQKIAKGIDAQQMMTARQLPRKPRIISATRPPEIRASRSTPWMAERTKTD